jgi:hypothetical protein
MSGKNRSRRDFLDDDVAAPALGAVALAGPGRAAAQAAVTILSLSRNRPRAR